MAEEPRTSSELGRCSFVLGSIVVLSVVIECEKVGHLTAIHEIESQAHGKMSFLRQVRLSSSTPEVLPS